MAEKEVTAFTKLDELAPEIANEAAKRAGLEPGVVTDFIFIYALRYFDGDGDAIERVGYVFPNDGRGSFHGALGMIDYAKTRIHHIITRAVDNNGD